MERLHLSEATLADLRRALDDGRCSSVELVAMHLNRIACYDRHGIRLNAVPVLNPKMFAEAAAADWRRACGERLSALDGIPYLAKDSFAAAGLTIAGGSPAFEHLVATRDAFAIARLRVAGAVLIGLTNMPPMAAGGMQRGLYGRAESPYNPAFLAAAYASGSSNGSGAGVAAGFAAFGLAEETWSSGRAPASNNGLVAYTPSRGMISARGNWPLVPTMDVVVPFARCMDDLLDILNILVVDDDDVRGDFWRIQKAVALPPASAVRPSDYAALRDAGALAGKRIGVPRMYINKENDAAGRPIMTRTSIIELWEAAARDLSDLGAEVMEVDFPLVSNYERSGPNARALIEQGLLPPEFTRAEGWDLVMFAWDDFLRAQADPALPTLTDVDGSRLMAQVPGSLPDLYEGTPPFPDLPRAARDGVTPFEAIPHLAEGLRGLEKARRRDFEEWMASRQIDFVVFPAVADVAPADSDYNPASHALAWKNGVWVANGNQAIRHLGVPTVTVPMGIMVDTRMPVGLTFAGAAYDDNALLGCAWAFEQRRVRRVPPPRTPPLPEEGHERTVRAAGVPAAIRLTFDVSVSAMNADGHVSIDVAGSAESDAGVRQVNVFINGAAAAVQRSGASFIAGASLPAGIHGVPHSPWRGPYGSIVLVVALADDGACAAGYEIAGGIG